MSSKRILSVLFSFLILLGTTSAALAADGAMVKSVDVKGNKTVSSLTILAKVKTHAGEPLSSVTLNEDLKRLYGLGFFTDVRIEQEEVTDGVNVSFIVAEKPVLADIKIE